MRVLRAILFSLLTSVPWSGHALVVEHGHERYNLLREVEVFVDPTRSVTAEQIRSDPAQFAFRPSSLLSSEINLGFTEAAVWVRLPLARAASAQGEWILEIPYLFLDSISFYAPGRSVVATGAGAPIESRPFHYRFFAFPLALTEERQDFLLRVESSYAVTIPLVLYTLSEFNNEQVTDTLFQALYYGGLLSLLFYNLILYLTVKDRQYLTYCLFTGFTGLGVFAGNGYARLYLWPDAIVWDPISQCTLFAVAGVLAMVFTAMFLGTRERQRKFHAVLMAVALTYLVLALLMVVTMFTDAVSRNRVFEVFFATTLAASCACLYSSLIAILQGQASAYYFSFAWGALAAGSIIASLRVFGAVPSNGFTLYALQIGSGIEMLLFSFALAYRIQSEQAMRETAQAESLKAKQAALDAMRASEDRLEQAVEKRTEKLQHLLLSEQAIHEQYVRFGAMIAHEFRNPLNIIEGQTSMLELEAKSGIGNAEKRAAAIRSATMRLANLFDQWLQSDRLNDMGGTALEALPIDLAEMLADLVRTSRSFHPERQFRLLPMPVLPPVMADTHMLQIAILNLLDNACKYSPADSTVTVSLSRHGDDVGISVRDDGCGIDARDLERIFDAYFRASSEKRIKGVGLGLAFVKRIADLHEGRIEVQSELEVGSTFTLWLPARFPDDPRASGLTAARAA